MTDTHLTEQTFRDLNLPEPLLKGTEAAGFTHCTPIQAEALPIALAGQDVAGQARTGTGKSAAFLLATLNQLLAHPAAAGRRPQQPRALIMAPTRELAIQIHKDAEVLDRFTDFKLGLVYGGTGYDSQRQMLEAGVDILIGTPGRIIDYFKQGVFDLKAIQVFVLDEADRMFDLGFIADIRYVLRRMPPADQRLSLLFSATLSHRVNELAYEHMHNPQVVKIESERVTVDTVTETLYFPASEEKIRLLLGLLQRMDPRRSLVFVNTKGGAENVRAWLEGNGYEAGVLSGDVPQTKRERLLAAFKDGKLPILVATDVAARGLHIPDVSHVFNYDLPQDPEDYVHRVGRTARAGASGDAISFACDRYAMTLPDIQDYLGHKLPSEAISEDLLVKPKPPVKIERRPERGRGGGERGRGGQRGRGGDRGRGAQRARGGGREQGRGPQRSDQTPPSERRPHPRHRAAPADSAQPEQPVATKVETKKDTPEPAAPARRSDKETPVIG